MKKLFATLSLVFFLAVAFSPLASASNISVNDATIVKVADEEPKKDDKKKAEKKDAKACDKKAEKKADKGCAEKKPCEAKKQACAGDK